MLVKLHRIMAPLNCDCQAISENSFTVDTILVNDFVLDMPFIVHYLAGWLLQSLFAPVLVLYFFSLYLAMSKSHWRPRPKYMIWYLLKAAEVYKLIYQTFECHFWKLLQLISWCQCIFYLCVYIFRLKCLLICLICYLITCLLLLCLLLSLWFLHSFSLSFSLMLVFFCLS